MRRQKPRREAKGLKEKKHAEARPQNKKGAGGGLHGRAGRDKAGHLSVGAAVFRKSPLEDPPAGVAPFPPDLA